MDEPDILIIGGGSAGCVLAARLSESPGIRVRLIEAGRDTPPGAIPDDIADLFPRAYANPAYFWPDLKAVGRTGSGARPFTQARILGGGSTVMGLWAVRGLPEDYDHWAANGAKGWSYEDVLPFFRKLERDLDIASPEHGADGPVAIRRIPSAEWPGFNRALAAAARRAPTARAAYLLQAPTSPRKCASARTSTSSRRRRRGRSSSRAEGQSARSSRGPTAVLRRSRRAR
jgi:5-(hydroxymethyl)furfural/furfural oxidase